MGAEPPEGAEVVPLHATPAWTAARRARAQRRGPAHRADRAYPEVPVDDDPDAPAVRLAAARAMLHARTPGQVAGALRTLVHDLGGAVVPARLGTGGASTLPVDVSLGLGEPMLVRADELSVGAVRLGALLGTALEDAHCALARLGHGPAEGPLPSSAGRVAPTSVQDLLCLLGSADAAGACALTTDLLALGHDVEAVVTDLLGPAQEEVGRLWQEGLWSVADEHAATAATESALGAAVLSVRAVRPSGLHVAFACAEGEWHALPARMAAAVAGSRGARVTVLGGSMPAAQLERRLAAGDVDVLALSCTLSTRLLGALRSVEAAHAVGVPVVAGGRAFGTTPHRALAVGADAWSLDPADLVAGPPPLRGDRVEVLPEVLLLDAPGPHLLDEAERRLAVVAPAVVPPGDPSRASVLADLLRHTAAAVLTGDPTVLQEGLDWYAARDLAALPAALVARAAVELAEGVAHEAPLGAAALRAAAR